MAHRLDEVQRDSVGPVWFSHYANAWLRRTGLFRTQIIATDEQVFRLRTRQ